MQLVTFQQISEDKQENKNENFPWLGNRIQKFMDVILMFVFLNQRYAVQSIGTPF